MNSKPDTNYEFTFIWKIENYSFCYHKNGESIGSPVFCANNLDGTKWYLQWFPRGESTDCEEYISFYLHRCSNDENDKIIDYRIEVVGGDGNILHTMSGFDEVFGKRSGGGWGYEKFFKIQKLENNMKKWKEDALTFRCHMSRGELKKGLITGCEAHTKIGIDKCNFKFALQYQDSPSWIESQNIHISETIHFEIILTAPDDKILVSVRKIDSEENLIIPQSVCFKISIIDVNEIEHYFKEEFHLFTTSKDVLEFPFIKKSQLEKYFSNNAIININCEGTFSNGIEYSKMQAYVFNETVKVDFSLKQDSYSTLKADLRSMFIRKKHCDIELKCNDDIFLAHKCVLIARSPVFSAMFDLDVREIQTEIVNVTDVDSEIFNQFLEFLYTDSITRINDVSAQKLLLVAEKYQVFSMKEMCCSFLMTSLSIENVCEVVRLANMVGHDVLKASAKAYIKNNATKILLSPKWSSWVSDNFKLATEIICDLSTELSS